MMPGVFAGAGAGGIAPPTYSVSALLHFEGADASTTFTDEVGNTWTAVGSAQIDTAQFQFGAASGLMTSGHIHTASSARFGFGAGEFTIEGWFRRAGSLTNRVIFDTRTASNQGIVVFACTSSFDGLAVGNNTAVLAGSATAFTLSTWQHFAVVRQGTTLRGYVGGVQVFTVTDSRTYASASTAYMGIAYIISQQLSGHIDEFRVTKGLCRYPDGTSFTPTGPFPNP